MSNATPSSIRLILASSSARRLDLLRQIGHEPIVQSVDVDEQARPGETPLALVRRLSRLKADAASQAGLDRPNVREVDRTAREAGAIEAHVALRHHDVILAADTVIDLDGDVLGKPRNAADAIRMLMALGGREHRVHTGVCLHRLAGVHTITVSTKVRFSRLNRAAAKQYVQTGEPFGKAGSYAIQGLGARFVSSISGSYSNVVGLPLHETARLLDAARIVADIACQRFDD